MNGIIRISSFLVFLICGLILFTCQAISAPLSSRFQVGLAGSAPFVIIGKNDYRGISTEIWELIAANGELSYEYQSFPTVHDALDQMIAGKLDVVVGPVSITSERAEQMKFSQPYYESSLTLLSRLDRPDFWERIRPFFSIQLLIAVIIFLFILAVVGTLIWLAERKASPEQFPPDPPRGIGNGMWLAIVTMSTTGYGDRAPITFWGRVIAGSWMVVSILFATSMVAGIASTLTLTGMGDKSISRIDQLNSKKVATIVESPAEDFLKERGIQPIVVSNLTDAYHMLKSKKVDAVFYDRPQLLFFLKQNHDADVVVSTHQYYEQGYGFAFPLNSDLNRKVSILLLQASEEGRLDRTLHFWLKSDE